MFLNNKVGKNTEQAENNLEEGVRDITHKVRLYCKWGKRKDCPTPLPALSIKLNNERRACVSATEIDRG